MNNKDNTPRTSGGFLHWQIISAILIIYDFIAVNMAYFAALWLRFDCRFTLIPDRYLQPWLHFVPIYTVICLVIFWRLRLYNAVWRFASYSELIRSTVASIITAIIHSVGITLIYRRMPMTYYVFGAVLQYILIVGVRFSYRLVLFLSSARLHTEHDDVPELRVMLIGAGSAGSGTCASTAKAVGCSAWRTAA